MSRFHAIGQYFLATAITLLAAALFYFAWTLAGYKAVVPSITASVSEISTAVQPIVDLTPNILQESADIRAQTNAVVEQSQVIVDALPAVIQEVENVRHESEQLREESAAIRAEVERVRREIPALLDEMAAYRQLAPDVLQESQAIRASLTPTLDRVETIVADLDSAASNAGESAVTGFFTGLVKAPINLMADVTGLVVPGRVSLSEDEKQLLEQTLQGFINTAIVGDSQQFQTDDGNFTGEVRMLSNFIDHNQACRRIHIDIKRKGENAHTGEVDVCRDSQGQWTVKKRE